MMEAANEASRMAAARAEFLADPRMERRASQRANFDRVLEEAESALSPRRNALRSAWRAWTAVWVQLRALRRSAVALRHGGFHRAFNTWIGVSIQLAALKRGARALSRKGQRRAFNSYILETDLRFVSFHFLMRTSTLTDGGR